MQEHDEPQEEEDEDQQKEQGENDGGDDGHRALHGPGYFKAHASLLVLLAAGTVGFGLLYGAMLDGKLDAFIRPAKPWMEHVDDAREVFAPQWMPLPAEMDMEENQDCGVCPNGELDDPEIVATLSSCDTINE